MISDTEAIELLRELPDPLAVTIASIILPYCSNCGHRCPAAASCKACGSDAMQQGDTLCVNCDTPEPAPAKAP